MPRTWLDRVRVGKVHNRSAEEESKYKRRSRRYHRAPYRILILTVIVGSVIIFLFTLQSAVQRLLFPTVVVVNDKSSDKSHSVMGLKDSPPPKVLLFITTHFPRPHIDFFNKCWPTSIHNSRLLRDADVMIFSTGNPSEAESHKKLIESVFPTNRIVIRTYKNPGYQKGATLPMTEAMANDWFGPYDWVVRLNPDVILRSDAWILETMRNEDVDGIFVNCLNLDDIKVHTDFFAVRPSALPSDSFQMTLGGEYTNAERLITREFKSILDSGRYRWLENAGVKMRGVCRVNKDMSPVIHSHDYLTICKHDLERWGKHPH